MIRWLVASAMVAVLTGGVAPPAPSSVSESDFVRVGRFALQAQRFNQNTENTQGGFSWQDRGAALVLDLTSPVGGTLARVTVERQASTLVRANGEQIKAESPDALIELAIGQPMPVSGLRDWLRGRLSPLAGDAKEALPRATTNLVRDEQGRLTAFLQDGWQVTLSRYDEFGPRALALRRAEAGQDVSIRIVIDQ